MDRSERIADLEESLRKAIKGEMTDLWTALPGIVKAVGDGTVDVQPAIQGQWLDPSKGQWQNVNLPLLLDCPVVFPSAGGITLTLPIQEGDEVLVVFSSRCIDNHWQSGGVQPQAEIRMHDLSDGFALPGYRSKPRKLANVSSSTAQLRNDAGTAYVELDASGAGVINMVAPGGVNITGDLSVSGVIAGLNSKNQAAAATINGTVHVVGALTTTQSIQAATTVTGSDVVASSAGVSLSSHHHLAPAGGGNTGGALP